jgi:hypothetical protein
MAIIKGGYKQVDIANNAEFSSADTDWTVELTGPFRAGTGFTAEPLQDDMADGMPAPAGIRYNFIINCTDLTAADYTDLIEADEDHTKVWVKFHHMVDGQYTVIKGARISVDFMPGSIPNYSVRQITGSGFGLTNSAVLDVEDGSA